MEDTLWHNDGDYAPKERYPADYLYPFESKVRQIDVPPKERAITPPHHKRGQRFQESPMTDLASPTRLQAQIKRLNKADSRWSKGLISTTIAGMKVEHNDGNIGRGGEVLLGMWPCCNKTDPDAPPCQLYSSHTQDQGQCSKCALFFDIYNGTPDGTCNFHKAPEPTPDSAYGGFTWSCCKKQTLNHTKYDANSDIRIGCRRGKHASVHSISNPDLCARCGQDRLQATPCAVHKGLYCPYKRVRKIVNPTPRTVKSFYPRKSDIPPMPKCPNLTHVMGGRKPNKCRRQKPPKQFVRPMIPVPFAPIDPRVFYHAEALLDLPRFIPAEGVTKRIELAKVVAPIIHPEVPHQSLPDYIAMYPQQSLSAPSSGPPRREPLPSESLANNAAEAMVPLEGEGQPPTIDLTTFDPAVYCRPSVIPKNVVVYDVMKFEKMDIPSGVIDCTQPPEHGLLARIFGQDFMQLDQKMKKKEIKSWFRPLESISPTPLPDKGKRRHSTTKEVKDLGTAPIQRTVESPGPPPCPTPLPTLPRMDDWCSDLTVFDSCPIPLRPVALKSSRRQNGIGLKQLDKTVLSKELLFSSFSDAPLAPDLSCVESHLAKTTPIPAVPARIHAPLRLSVHFSKDRNTQEVRYIPLARGAMDSERDPTQVKPDRLGPKPNGTANTNNFTRAFTPISNPKKQGRLWGSSSKKKLIQWRDSGDGHPVQRSLSARALSTNKAPIGRRTSHHALVRPQPVELHDPPLVAPKRRLSTEEGRINGRGSGPHQRLPSPPNGSYSSAGVKRQIMEEPDGLAFFLKRLGFSQHISHFKKMGVTKPEDLQLLEHREWTQIKQLLLPLEVRTLERAIGEMQQGRVIAPPLPLGKRFHAFISHKKERSEALALNIADNLSARFNLSCFFDRDALRNSCITKENIVANVRSSSCLVAILDPNTVSSDWCRLEWQTAWEYGVPIVPVYDKDRHNNAEFKQIVDGLLARNYHFVVERSAVEYSMRSRMEALLDIYEMVCQTLGEEHRLSSGSKKHLLEHLRKITPVPTEASSKEQIEDFVQLHDLQLEVPSSRQLSKTVLLQKIKGKLGNRRPGTQNKPTCTPSGPGQMEGSPSPLRYYERQQAINPPARPQSASPRRIGQQERPKSAHDLRTDFPSIQTDLNGKANHFVPGRSKSFTDKVGNQFDSEKSEWRQRTGKLEERALQYSGSGSSYSSAEEGGSPSGSRTHNGRSASFLNQQISAPQNNVRPHSAKEMRSKFNVPVEVQDRPKSANTLNSDNRYPQAEEERSSVGTYERPTTYLNPRTNRKSTIPPGILRPQSARERRRQTIPAVDRSNRPKSANLGRRSLGDGNFQAPRKNVSFSGQADQVCEYTPGTSLTKSISAINLKDDAEKMNPTTPISHEIYKPSEMNARPNGYLLPADNPGSSSENSEISSYNGLQQRYVSQMSNRLDGPPLISRPHYGPPGNTPFRPFPRSRPRILDLPQGPNQPQSVPGREGCHVSTYPRIISNQTMEVGWQEKWDQPLTDETRQCFAGDGQPVRSCSPIVLPHDGFQAEATTEFDFKRNGTLRQSGKYYNGSESQPQNESTGSPPYFPKDLEEMEEDFELLALDGMAIDVRHNEIEYLHKKIEAFQKNRPSLQPSAMDRNHPIVSFEKSQGLNQQRRNQHSIFQDPTRPETWNDSSDLSKERQAPFYIGYGDHIRRKHQGSMRRISQGNL